LFFNLPLPPTSRLFPYTTLFRSPNPWFTRGTSTSSQCAMPLADYCYKTLNMRRMAVIADDIAYGHEMCAGFMRAFEELGGKVVQDRKSTRLNSSHVAISYAVFYL